MYTLNCKGRILTWDTPIVMGILNITPDSFFAGSRMESTDQLLTKASRMLAEGASILDLGGLSTRPGATEISVDAELDRLLPAIEAISGNFPDIIISVDSYRYKPARAALEAGAAIVNDIGAAPDEKLPELAAASGTPYICMHMRGTPATMQTMTGYDNLMPDLIDFFVEKKRALLDLGIKDIIIDPGFGFAKTIQQNFHLLRNLHLLSMLDAPVLAGLSRKATVYKTLGLSPESSLNGTTVLHTLALTQGAQILRVHDVREAVEAIRLWTSYASA